MAYREDADLAFLRQCSSEDLDPLVRYLTRDKDGDLRWTEELTQTEAYRKYYPDHRQYWKEIAAELQTFGANTIATILRGGKGVLYREILTDVCDRMEVNYNPNASIQFIESSLLMKILVDSLDEMDEEAKGQLVKALNLKTTSLAGPAIAAALQAAVRMGGFASYKLAVIVANAVARQVLGHGLSVAGNALLTRTLGVLAGPIGWTLTGMWALVKIAGPAYRVTIPSVIHVAFLRAKAANGGDC